MTLPEWACKRGDDFTAPQAIVISVDDVAADLTDTDWTVAAQARPRNPTDPDTAVDFDVSDDSVLLAAGKVLLSLPRSITETMAVGAWRVDVQATNDTITGVGRKSSATFSLTIQQDVTQVVEGP
jgi:hypothetical protein